MIPLIIKFSTSLYATVNSNDEDNSNTQEKEFGHANR